MSRVWPVLIWILCVALPLSAARAEPSQITVGKAYYEDVSGLLTLADVAERPLTPFSGRLGAGYGSSAYWVRLTLSHVPPSSSDPGHALVLRITPTFIDQIAVYQTCNGKTDTHYIGDRYPVSGQAYPALSLNLFLAPCAVAEPIWLRIESTSTRTADIEVLTADEALNIDFRRFMAVLLGAGIILFLLALIAIYDHNTKDPVLTAFAFHQLAIVAVVLLNNGVVRAVFDIDPHILDRASSFSTVLVELALLFFNLRFLQSYTITRFLEPVIYGLVAITCLNLAFVFTPWRGQAILINAMVISASIVFFFLATLTIKRDGKDETILPRRIVIFYYGAVTAFVAPPIISLFGLGNLFTPDIATVYGMFTTFVMSSMLVVRARRLSHLEEVARLEIAFGLQRMKEEQKFRDQQEQLFTMLVHEVKTPIAALKIALTNAASLDAVREKASRHLDAVTTIINHCNQAYRLEDPAFQVAASQVSLSKMLAKAIGDNDIDIRIGAGVPEDIDTDPQLFEAIVGNLVDNAARYKAAGTVPELSVGLAVRHAVNGLTIEVSNRPGVSGVPDEKRLFAKYYRSSNAHHTSGSGLGLFLAHRSAIRLNGELTYRYDGHIRFCLWLPL